MQTSANQGYISADSHVVEPADLWLTRMDKRFRDRAPRIESRPKGDYYLIDGLPAMPHSGMEGAMMEEKIAKGTIEKLMGRRHRETRPGAWDAQARLVDQDLDHICAEVIYPGIFGLHFSLTPDPEYQQECIRVYNDWLSELGAAAPQRLLGVGLLPMNGPAAWAIKEAQRCARLGLPSISIPQLVTDRPYDRPEWDPLWAALQELGLPVAIHVGTGKGMHEVYARAHHIGRFMLELHCMAYTFADLIWGGVAQRYPQLRFVSVEAGIGWIAAQFQPWDRMWSDHYTWLRPKLDEPPSFYFRRQFWATFERDRAGILTRELLNVDHLLWGSDYPHLEGTFPQSQEMVAKVFAGVPEEETRKMVRENAAALYNL